MTATLLKLVANLLTFHVTGRNTLGLNLRSEWERTQTLSGTWFDRTVGALMRLPLGACALNRIVPPSSACTTATTRVFGILRSDSRGLEAVSRPSELVENERDSHVHVAVRVGVGPHEDSLA